MDPREFDYATESSQKARQEVEKIRRFISQYALEIGEAERTDTPWVGRVAFRFMDNSGGYSRKFFEKYPIDFSDFTVNVVIDHFVDDYYPEGGEYQKPIDFDPPLEVLGPSSFRMYLRSEESQDPVPHLQRFKELVQKEAEKVKDYLEKRIPALESSEKMIAEGQARTRREDTMARQASQNINQKLRDSKI